MSHSSFAECITEKKKKTTKKKQQQKKKQQKKQQQQQQQKTNKQILQQGERESKSRWYATAIRIDYIARLYRPPIVECRRLKCLAT